jgi:hypothetical protein
LNILVNSFIFIDLFLTINNPFYPRFKRVRWYAIILLGSTIGLFSCLNKSIKDNGTSIALYDRDAQGLLINILQILTICSIVISFVPFLLVLVRLRKKGTSKDLRNKVFRRHVISFLLFLSIILRVVYMQWGL